MWNCGVAVADQLFFKSCGITIAEVLPFSCGIAIADSKKSCACPPLNITAINTLNIAYIPVTVISYILYTVGMVPDSELSEKLDLDTEHDVADPQRCCRPPTSNLIYCNCLFLVCSLSSLVQSNLDAIELKNIYGLNPLAKEFVPKGDERNSQNTTHRLFQNYKFWGGAKLVFIALLLLVIYIPTSAPSHVGT